MMRLFLATFIHFAGLGLTWFGFGQFNGTSRQSSLLKPSFEHVRGIGADERPAR